MCSNPQETVDFLTFTEKIPNGKLHFLCSWNKNFCVKWHFFVKNSENYHPAVWREKGIKLGLVSISKKTEKYFTSKNKISSAIDKIVYCSMNNISSPIHRISISPNVAKSK